MVRRSLRTPTGCRASWSAATPSRPLPSGIDHAVGTALQAEDARSGAAGLTSTVVGFKVRLNAFSNCRYEPGTSIGRGWTRVAPEHRRIAGHRVSREPVFRRRAVG